MDKKVMEALEAALLLKGLNKGLAKFFQIEKVEDVDNAVAEYVAVATPASALTLDQMIANPEVKRYLDQERTKAVSTNTQNLAKKYGFDPAKEPATPPADPGDQVPQYIKDIMTKLDETTQELTALKSGKEVETKRSQALSLLNGSKVIPENVRKKWETRFDLNGDTPLEDQLKALETEYTEIEQDFKNSGHYSGKPQTGFTSDKPSEAELDEVVTV